MWTIIAYLVVGLAVSGVMGLLLGGIFGAIHNLGPSTDAGDNDDFTSFGEFDSIGDSDDVEATSDSDS